MSKHSVVQDELRIRGAGVYCIMPYEKKDEKGNCLFKIGMTAKSFKDRIEQYNSYYPLGVYLVAFLCNPNVRNNNAKTKKELYTIIERRVMDKIKERDGIQLHSTARVKNLNVEEKGETEFFYTSQSVIKNVFDEIQEEYGGDVSYFNLNNINRKAEASKRKKPNYVAEIVYPLPNPVEE